MPLYYGASHLGAGTSLRNQGSNVLQRTIDRGMEERLRERAEYEANRRQERQIRAQKAMQKHAETVANERMWTQMGIGVGAGAVGGGLAGLAAAPAAAAGTAGAAGATTAATTAATAAPAVGGSVGGIASAAPMSLDGAKMAVPDTTSALARPIPTAPPAVAAPSVDMPSAGTRFLTGAGLGATDAITGGNNAGAYASRIATAPATGLRSQLLAAQIANTGLAGGLTAERIATEAGRRPGRIDMDRSAADENWAQAGAADASARARDASAGLAGARTETENLMREPRLTTETNKGRAAGGLADLREQQHGFKAEDYPLAIEQRKANISNIDQRTDTSKASMGKFAAGEDRERATAEKIRQGGGGPSNAMDSERAYQMSTQVEKDLQGRPPAEQEAIIDDFINSNERYLSPGDAVALKRRFMQKYGWKPRGRPTGKATVGPSGGFAE